MKEVDQLRSIDSKAPTVIQICTAVAADLMTVATGLPTSVATVFIEKYKNQKINEAVDILISELNKGNLAVLSDENLKSFIPNAYSFLEAARRGEYEHNLRLLAALLIQNAPLESPDNGTVARMARRIESMSLEEMNVMAAADVAFKKAESDSEFDGFHLFIEDNDVLEQLEYERTKIFMIQSHLSDLVSRGFLYMGSDPKVIGGEFFYKTPAFDELIRLARERGAQVL